MKAYTIFQILLIPVELYIVYRIIKRRKAKKAAIDALPFLYCNVQIIDKRAETEVEGYYNIYSKQNYTFLFQFEDGSRISYYPSKEEYEVYLVNDIVTIKYKQKEDGAIIIYAISPAQLAQK